MKGLVSLAKPPPDASEAKATSSTTTRPLSWSALGSLRGDANAKSARVTVTFVMPDAGDMFETETTGAPERSELLGGVVTASPLASNTSMTDIALEFDRNGLIPVVVQDHLTGEVRMLAHATIEAVRATLESGKATFWSRSRNELWEKGRTSGNTLAVHRVLVDCDDDC